MWLLEIKQFFILFQALVFQQGERGRGREKERETL